MWSTWHDYEFVLAVDLDPDEQDQVEHALFIEAELMIDTLPDAAQRDPTEGRVRWFQRTRGLKVDGIAGEETRRALIGEYMALDGTSLPKSIEVVPHGCGENFPRDDTVNGVADPDNRRVEIFFFKDKLGVQPPPAGKNAAKGSKEYPEWVGRAGEPIDFSAEGDVVTLDIEWAADMVDHLPGEVSIVLSGDGMSPQEHFLGLADRSGGVARLSFGELHRSQSVTLTAKKEDRELVLLRDQLAGDLEDAFVWEHRLEELLVPEPPNDGEFVASGGPPNDAHEEQSSGEAVLV